MHALCAGTPFDTTAEPVYGSLNQLLTCPYPPLPALPAGPCAEASHEMLATFYPTLSAIMLDALLRQAEAAEAGPGAPQPEPGAWLTGAC